MKMNNIKYVKCSICGIISFNKSGSSCCGGFWDYLTDKEVEILLDKTNIKF